MQNLSGVKHAKQPFKTLKEKLVSAPVLAYPTKEDVYILDCDASLTGVGAVLSQIQNGEEKPIAYGSKTLTKTQQNYCTTMRELLAVVVFIKQFHHYLWGRKFIVRTDHASLTWLINFKEPTGMLARWMSVLGNYDFQIEHRKGVAHQNADSLSRKGSTKCKRVDCETCALETKDCICLVSSCPVVDRPTDDYFEEKLVENSLSRQTLRHDFKSKSCVDLSQLSDCSSFCGQEYETHKSRSCDDLRTLSDIDVDMTVLQARYIEFASDSEDSESEFFDSEDMCISDVSESETEVRDPKTESDVSEVQQNEVCVITRSQTKKLAETIPADDERRQNLSSGSKLVQNKEVRKQLPPNWVDSWSIAEIREMQNQDEVLGKFKKFKTRRTDPPDKQSLYSEDTEYKALCSQWDNLEIHDDILYRKWIPEDPRDPEFLQIVVPDVLRKEILRMLHSHKTAGHLGIAKTLGKLRQRFYWVGHKADVVRWCKECKICERVNISLNPKRAPLQPKPAFSRMERIACDIMGPLPITERNNSYILVVVDYFTKFTEAYAIPDISAQTVADTIVTQWICRYGTPTILHSDQGRQFESQLFQEMCKLLDIHKTRTARYRPNSDGVCERNNRSIKKLLRSTTGDKPWKLG